MSDDWKAGDLAVCIGNGGTKIGLGDGVLRIKGSAKKGRAYRVTGAHVFGKGVVVLNFSDLPPPGEAVGWDARCFRKLNDEPDDIALIERIKKCQPAKETANV